MATSTAIYGDDEVGDLVPGGEDAAVVGPDPTPGGGGRRRIVNIYDDEVYLGLRL
jgi:hypothetical protein